MHSNGLAPIYRSIRSLSWWLTLVHSYPQLNMEFHKALFWVRFCSYCIRVSWKALYVAMASHLTAIELTASSSFSADQMSRWAGQAQAAVVTCISNVSDWMKWMSSNRLKLNSTKMEFLWVAMSTRLHLMDHSAIAVSGEDIKPSKYVQLLCVLSLKSQVNKPVSTGSTSYNKSRPYASAFLKMLQRVWSAHSWYHI